MKDIQGMRRDYTKGELHRSELLDDPLQQFSRWFEQATEVESSEPNIMCIATADREGKVQNRIVLLKDITDHGLVFFTNYDSFKAQDIAQNPRVAVVFYWEKLQRQVRIEGTVRKYSPAKSQDYFRSRPRGSQLAAWSSPQSRVLSDREALDKLYHDATEKFQDQDLLDKPPHWGGYEIIGDRFEYWQGRSSRLHDRFEYRRSPGGWIINRLAP